MMITLEMFEQSGVNLEVTEVKTVANVLIRRNTNDPDWTFEKCLAHLQTRAKQIADKKREDQAAKAKRDNESIKPRSATDKDLDKSRTRVQTTFRRGVKGKLNPTVKAEGKALSCKSSGSKERVKPSAKKPDGWNTTSQGAGNVIGAKYREESAPVTKGFVFNK